MTQQKLEEVLAELVAVCDKTVMHADYMTENSSGKDLATQLMVYNILRVMLEKAEEVTKCINRNMPVVAERATVQMQTDDVTSYSTGGYTFSVKSKHYVSSNKANEQLLHTWLLSDDNGKHLVRPSVHPASLTKYIIEQYIDKGEAPPAFINVFSKAELAVRKNRS